MNYDKFQHLAVSFYNALFECLKKSFSFWVAPPKKKWGPPKVPPPPPRPPIGWCEFTTPWQNNKQKI